METAVLTGIRRINRIVALLIGAILMLCAAFVLAEIVMRKVGSSLGGTDEISGYVMAIVTSWGMAYTLLELGHVRIDILRGRLGQVGRSVLDLGAMICLTGTVTTIAYWSWPVVSRSIANDAHANTALETPLALVQIPWFAGWLWFAVASWLTLLAALSLVVRGRFEAADQAIGAFNEVESLK